MNAMKSYAPRTMEELFAALGQMTEKSKLLGGGTDMIIQLQSGKLQPDALLYIGDIAELKKIELTDDALIIGAAVTMQELAESPLLGEEFRAMADAACDIGSPQIRNKATVAGNIANASPAGDLPPTLYLLEAKAVIAGVGCKTRTIPIHELITGPSRNSLAVGEAVIRFILPRNSWQGWRSVFVKLGFRGRVTVSRIGFTVALRQNVHGVIEDARVWVGAISLTPVRMEDAEALMKGRKPDKELANEVAELLKALLMKITPEKFDRDYKISAARGVVEDALARFQ